MLAHNKEVLPPKKPEIFFMRLSYSSIGTYEQCSLKYKYHDIDKLPEPKSKEALFGTLIHSTMKFIHTPALLQPTFEQAVDHFSRGWREDVFDSPLEERSAFTQGVEMIRRYYESNDIAIATIVDLESRFQMEIGNDEVGKHIIAGSIDRIDKTKDGYEIIDYKTAKKMPPQSKVDEDLQLTVYLRAFLERYPAERKNLSNITVSLYFLKHGVKLSAKRTEEDLARLDEKVLSVIRDIQAEKFEPTLSPLCDWCGYQKICPLWKHKFTETRKFETEAVKQSVAEYIELKNELSAKKKKMAELQETLFGYMEQEGVDRVFGDAAVIAKSIRKTYKYDEGILRSVLEPIGEWESVRKVDGILLRKKLGSVPLDIRKKIEEEGKKLDKETVSLTVKKGNYGEDEGELGEGEVA